MNEQFIQGLSIDWSKIDSHSYLRKIEALKKMERLDFTNPITFFVGENGSGKSTLLEAIAISYGFNPEGGTKNYRFSTYDSHSDLCNAMRLSKGYRSAKWGYFLRAESFYNVAHRKKNIPILPIHRSVSMKSHMVKASLLWHRINYAQMAFIFLTSQKQHFPLKDNSHSLWKFTNVRNKDHNLLL